MEFEDILSDVGRYGKYQQKAVFLFLFPATSFVPWFIMTNLFLVSVPDHWCSVPEFEDNPNVTRPVGDPSCSMYNTSLHASDGQRNYSEEVIPCNNGWTFDKTNYESTAATKWHLVCDRSHYTSLVLTLQNAGGVLGTPIYSSFSDKFGRKSVYFVVVLVAAVSNFMSAFAPDFTTFAVFRTIQGTIYPTILILPYILVLEIVPPEKRTRTSYMWNFSWVTGMCVLPLVVYLSRTWRILCWVNAGAAAFLLLYWRFIPESPRWLVSQKRFEEARDIMLDIAKENGVVADPKNLLLNLQSLEEKSETTEKRNFYSFIKFPRLRKHFFILTICCYANLVLYSGIHYNITNLEGNEFLVFFLLSLAEAPGIILLLLLMDRIGRRWSAVGCYTVATITCAAPITGLPHSEVVSSMIAKFIVAGLFMVSDQQSCELYPTVARSFGIGTAKSIANGVTFFLPYIIHLSIYGKAIPFVFFSLTCLMGGIATSFLPETLDKNLPQTVADAEEFGKDQKYFSFKP